MKRTALKRKPAKRRPPMARKPTKRKRRAPGVGCQRKSRKVCRRNHVTILNGVRLCAMHAADQLFGEEIRSRGSCQVAAMFPDVACNGELQCSHIVSRRYHAVRWDEANALASCAAHHVYTTHHPLEWEEAHGEVWTLLRRGALAWPVQNPLEIIERYRP